MPAHLQHEPIDLESFLSQKPEPSCGATAHFVGWVRNHHQGKAVKKLRYEAYTDLAEKELARLIKEVKAEFGVDDIQVIHRVGWVAIGEAAVAIWVASPHRGEAFQACQTLMDRIKSSVPIWKEEHYTDGSRDWVTCSHPSLTA